MSLYSKPKTALLLLIALVLLSFYSLKNLNISCRVPSVNEVYSVEFEYFGIDSEQIEKIIAEPLEEKIRAIDGLIELTTTCEYSKCTTTALFKRSDAGKSPYIALSDAVDSLYRTLPADAQRPHIYSSSAEQKAIFLAAFDQKPPALEKEIKAKLQAIAGVSEVLILGGDNEEIQAAFDGQRLSQAAIFPWDIANEIQSQNERGSLAIMSGEAFDKKIFFGTEINSIESIRTIPLNSVPLYTLAEVEFENQRQDKIVRINGKECVLLSVKTSSPEKTIKITREVKKVLDAHLGKEFAMKTIYDNGAEQSQMLLKIFAALLQSLIASIAIVFVAFASVKITALVSGFLCLDLLFSLALLSLLKIPLDISTLSGITISIGLVSDSALFVCDIFCASKAQSEFHLRLKKSIPALVISTATTVSVIAPLIVAESVVGGIKNLAITSSLMVAVSAILAVIFLPIALNSNDTENCEKSKFLQNSSNFIHFYYDKSYIISKIQNTYRSLPIYKFSYSIRNFIIYRNKIFRLAIFAIGTLLPAALFFLSAKNLSMASSSKIIYSQIEYNPERSYKSADKDALPFIEKIQKVQGVDYVRSEARRGCVELEIVVNKLSQKEKIAREISEMENGLSGFLYVPLPAPKTKPVQSIQVAILGNENSVCRKIAKEAAEFLQTENFFTKNQSQVVLNFKDEERIISAKPIRPLLAKNKIALNSLASFLRWNLFAPVADKILLGGKIYDLRAGEKNSAFCDNSTLENVKTLSIPVSFETDTENNASGKPETSSISVSSVFDFCEEKMPSKIYRKNSRRAAYFTIEVQSKKSDLTFSELKASLAKLNLPEGYSFSYPREFVQMHDNYAKIFAAFIFAVFAIFILIAAQCENIKSSLKTLFTIPLSLVVPLALRAVFRQPLQLGDAVAMVFLSGLCVNNALYILNELNDNAKTTTPKEASNSLLKSIVSSSLTTICGAIPVMILAQDEFSASLAFFMFWGTLGALISGVSIFPKTLENNTNIQQKKEVNLC